MRRYIPDPLLGCLFLASSGTSLCNCCGVSSRPPTGADSRGPSPYNANYIGVSRHGGTNDEVLDDAAKKQHAKRDFFVIKDKDENSSIIVSWVDIHTSERIWGELKKPAAAPTLPNRDANGRFVSANTAGGWL